jgi:hypothetical protein
VGFAELLAPSVGLLLFHLFSHLALSSIGAHIPLLSSELVPHLMEPSFASFTL